MINVCPRFGVSGDKEVVRKLDRHRRLLGLVPVLLLLDEPLDGLVIYLNSVLLQQPHLCLIPGSSRLVAYSLGPVRGLLFEMREAKLAHQGSSCLLRVDTLVRRLMRCVATALANRDLRLPVLLALKMRGFVTGRHKLVVRALLLLPRRAVEQVLPLNGKLYFLLLAPLQVIPLMTFSVDGRQRILLIRPNLVRWCINRSIYVFIGLVKVVSPTLVDVRR